MEGGLEEISMLNVKQKGFLAKEECLLLVTRGNGRAFSEIFTPTQQPQHCAVLLYQLILSISKPSAFPLQQKKA